MTHSYSEDKLIEQTCMNLFHQELGWDKANTYVGESSGIGNMICKCRSLSKAKSKTQRSQGYPLAPIDESNHRSMKILKNYAITILTLGCIAFMLPSCESYDEGYDDGYSEGYDEGKRDGYEEGYKEGHEEGYEEGYDEGYRIGKRRGYDEGYDDCQSGW